MNTVLTLLILIAGFVIALQQWRTAREKLRLDLYPRRYAIFSTVLDAIISALNQSGSAVFDEGTQALGLAIREARFLFSSENFTYLNQIETCILQYRHVYTSIKAGHRPTVHDGGSQFNQFNRDQQFLLQCMRDLPVRLQPAIKIDDKLSFSTEQQKASIEAVVKRLGLTVQS